MDVCPVTLRAYFGYFGTPSPDGIIYGYGWTDSGVQVELVWPSVTEEPVPRIQWETYNLILSALSKGKPYTPEMMRLLSDPRLKQMLLEEICKKAV